MVVVTEHGDQFVEARRPDAEHFHFAGLDEVQTIGRLSLGVDDLTCRVFLGRQPSGQGGEQCLVRIGERRHAAEPLHRGRGLSSRIFLSRAMLPLPHPEVEPATLHQLVMGAVLDDTPRLQRDDAPGVRCGLEPVRDRVVNL